MSSGIFIKVPTENKNGIRNNFIINEKEEINGINTSNRLINLKHNIYNYYEVLIIKN